MGCVTALLSRIPAAELPLPAAGSEPFALPFAVTGSEHCLQKTFAPNFMVREF